MFSKNEIILKVSKVKLTIITSLILKCVLLALFWSEYSKIAPDPYQIWGADEAHWYEKSILVEHSIEGFGFIHTALNLTNITSTVHCGWPFLAGSIFYIFGKNVFFVLLSKQLIYAIGVLYIYKLSYFVTNSFKTSYIVLLFTIIYPPLTIYSFSFMREEILFTLITFNLFLICKLDKKMYSYYDCINILLTTIIIFTYRVHIGCIFMIIYFILIAKGKQGIKNITYFTIILVLLLFLSNKYIIWGINIISYYEFNVNLIDYVYSFVRFLLSPLPWQIVIDNHNRYNIFWYSFTLTFLILSIPLVKYILQSILKHKIFSFFIIFYFTAYMVNVSKLGASNLAIGPRQFALIGPLFFLTAYSVILKKLKLPNINSNIKKTLIK